MFNNIKNKEKFRPFSGINLNKNNSLITLNQSPKIYSSKFREFIKEKNKNNNNNNKKLFSLNDINDKITNSRGIQFSPSFKRYSIEELKKILNKNEFQKLNNKEKKIPKSYRITNKSQTSKDLIQRCYSAT